MERYVQRYGIIALIVVYLLLSIVYHATIPLGEGPDEPGHMNYVLFLAREGRLPIQQFPDSKSDVPGEGHQPPLAYILALPSVLWLPSEALVIHQSSNPQFLWHGGSEAAAFIRSSNEYFPWRGLPLAWHIARGVSTLLGAITIFCVWGSARSFFRNDYQASLLSAAFVALHPQFLFTSALVTNDMLLITLSAALFWLCIAFPHMPPHHIWYASCGAGILLGLALLTKQNALFLVPLVMWTAWLVGKSECRLAVIFLTLSLLIALAIPAAWYLRNWYLYNDVMGLESFQATFTTQTFNWHDRYAWYYGFKQLHHSFWAMFGWISLPAPIWFILPYVVLEIVAIGGLLKSRNHQDAVDKLHASIGRGLPMARPKGLAIARPKGLAMARPKGLAMARPKGLAMPNPYKSGFAIGNHQGANHSLPDGRGSFLAVILMPILTFLWVVAFALVAGMVAWQGRMLFPALPSIAILLTLGLLSWNWKPPLTLLITVLFLLALYAPLGIIAPAYAWHTARPTEAQSRIETPVYARFAKEWEQGIELRGWRLQADHRQSLSTKKVVAGQTVTATLTWHALERVTYDWTVFVHLVDAKGKIVAQHNSQPQRGIFPMTRWTVDDWIEDEHVLPLPSDVPNGSYTLRVGLFKQWRSAPEKGSRQLVWDSAGASLGQYVAIGTIEVGNY